MSTEIYRKYLDIINENSQPVEQLNEGMISSIAQKLAGKLMKMLDPKTQEAIATAVKDVTGGDYSLTMANAMKVAKALGIDAQDAKADASGSVQEELGLAGNWQGKLLQAIHGLGVAHLIMTFMGQGVFDSQAVNNWVAAIGLILLMVTHTFWSTDKGMVGAMGRK